jgi:3-hydroxyisobutyrate dehydrogenase-like beta-hydroxyacid dehydrogenase
MVSDAKSAVSVVGLGNMGTALATVLAERGHPRTVWNRTASRAESIIAVRAAAAGSTAEAIAASPITRLLAARLRPGA